MRIYDITEQHLDEIPSSSIKQAVQSKASRLMNKLPSQAAKSKAANIAAKADLGKTANMLHADFNAYLGRQDKNMNQATGEDLRKFLKLKRHKTQQEIPQGVIPKQTLDSVLIKIAREAMDQDEQPSDNDDDNRDSGSNDNNSRTRSRSNNNSRENRDTYQRAKKKIRKVTGGDRKMPVRIKRDIRDALEKFAKGDENFGIYAAKKILKLAKAGVDVSNAKQQWIASSKANDRVLTQSVYYEITQMLRENGLSWSSIGIKIELLENTNRLVRIKESG